MGFLGKIVSKGGTFLGNAVQKVKTGFSEGGALSKAIDKTTTTISYASSFFSDILSLVQPFFPELSPVNDLLVAIKDTSDTVNKMGQGGGFLDVLKEGTMNLIKDEIAGNTPIYNQYAAGKDLLQKSTSYLKKRFSTSDLELS